MSDYQHNSTLNALVERFENPYWKIASVATFVISIVAFSYLFGWKVGVLFALGIALHELGHHFAAIYFGVPAGWPLFIPFLGAFVALDPREIEDRHAYATIGMAGPLAGLMYSFALSILAEYWFTTWRGAALEASGINVIINLANMVPFLPFDGGHVRRAVGDWPKYFVGLPLIIAWTVWTNWNFSLYQDPWPLLIIVAVSWDFFGPKLRMVRAVLDVALITLVVGIILFGTSMKGYVMIFFWFKVITGTIGLGATYIADWVYAKALREYEEATENGRSSFYRSLRYFSTEEPKMPQHSMVDVRPHHLTVLRCAWAFAWCAYLLCCWLLIDTLRVQALI